jgi:hypothetical protein
MDAASSVRYRLRANELFRCDLMCLNPSSTPGLILLSNLELGFFL